jgi:hypothetical protein
LCAWLEGEGWGVLESFHFVEFFVLDGTIGLGGHRCFGRCVVCIAILLVVGVKWEGECSSDKETVGYQFLFERVV